MIGVPHMRAAAWAGKGDRWLDPGNSTPPRGATQAVWSPGGLALSVLQRFRDCGGGPVRLAEFCRDCDPEAMIALPMII